MSYLPKLFLFFAFFISFAIINFTSAQWGLQMSWCIAILMILFFPFIFGTKFRIPINVNFKYTTFFFSILILLTIVSWILQDNEVILFPDEDILELRSRSIPHIIYLIFEYIIYLFLIIYLYQSNSRISINWFIVYPFYAITIYGIYQWLTTFDILPYTEIFNNNASTGFTYLRFKYAHRACSVFPEPSEYAYYLGFMLPFVLAPFFNKHNYKHIEFFKNRKISIMLYAFAVITSGSMSLFMVMPLLLFLVCRKYMQLSYKFYLKYGMIFCFILVIIILLQKDRLADIGGGNDGSALIRFMAFEQTLNLFKSSPLIGAGFGAVRGLDLISFMLGTTGIIGTCGFFVLIYKLKSFTSINSVFKTGFICMIITALFSNPIIDHTFFWPILAFNTVPLKFSNK